ncbi:5-hydroxyisourate hydrolase-like [Cataglyphis hispanica]|uniref:5-hydroxyisourate hydrolase-like n=1 Tax=Cataglyphis hispanica TaxID=1086592 RepID=UPI00217FFAFC|nr:5-hydroxyisourate hydrolase-like [Cataglyphis hispanica]
MNTRLEDSRMNTSVNPNEAKLSITTHVLNTSTGLPADGLAVCLFKFENDKWILLEESTTGSNGRCADLLQDQRENSTPGRFKIEFRVNDYFRRNATISMYPLIDVVFDVQNHHEHYHIPLLLSPFGFTTYRGS